MTETTPETGTLEAVKAAIRNFEVTQTKYRDYGAHDTEPDCIFQHILWKVINDEDTSIPMSGAGWELYANSMDCDEAANALHLACLGAVQQLFACPIAERKKLRAYLKDYCWRYN
jgi:hypothetical protein